jgi:hypothetical protein
MDTLDSQEGLAEEPPSALPFECAWCVRESGQESAPWFTDGVCERHRRLVMREARRQVRARRERAARRRALLS